MARIALLEDDDLTAEQRAQVEAVEAAGGDASVLRATAHLPEFFKAYFAFYYTAHEGGLLPAALKELVRLKIARLNDCFT